MIFLLWYFALGTAGAAWFAHKYPSDLHPFRSEVDSFALLAFGLLTLFGPLLLGAALFDLFVLLIDRMMYAGPRANPEKREP